MKAELVCGIHSGTSRQLEIVCGIRWAFNKCLLNEHIPWNYLVGFGKPQKAAET